MRKAISARRLVFATRVAALHRHGRLSITAVSESLITAALTLVQLQVRIRYRYCGNGLFTGSCLEKTANKILCINVL